MCWSSPAKLGTGVPGRWPRLEPTITLPMIHRFEFPFSAWVLCFQHWELPASKEARIMFS